MVLEEGMLSAAEILSRGRIKSIPKPKCDKCGAYTILRIDKDAMELALHHAISPETAKELLLKLKDGGIFNPTWIAEIVCEYSTMCGYDPLEHADWLLGKFWKIPIRKETGDMDTKIKGICYDGTAKASKMGTINLEMEMTDGLKYVFFDVPAEVYEALAHCMATADDAEKYYQKNIRGKYRYMRVESVQHDYL